MSDPTVRGVVHVIEETKTYGQSGFRKRLVVLEQDLGRFTNYLPIEFVRDDCDRIDDWKVGDEVEIGYRLSGRKWQRDPQSEVKYFLSAEATRYQVVGSGPSKEVSSDANEAFAEASDDDVPF